MANDLISRAALLEKECCGRISGDDVRNAPAVDAEPVRHDGCALCKIKETGHGIIAYYAVGWEVCITKRGKSYCMVVGHEGDQIYIPIGYCPACGAKLDEKAVPVKNCSTCENSGWDMPQCKECSAQNGFKWFKEQSRA